MDKSHIQRYIDEYLAKMSEKEKKAYDIAKSHLGESYTLEKSNAFLQFVKKEKEKQEKEKQENLG